MLNKSDLHDIYTQLKWLKDTKTTDISNYTEKSHSLLENFFEDLENSDESTISNKNLENNISISCKETDIIPELFAHILKYSKNFIMGNEEITVEDSLNSKINKITLECTNNKESILSAICDLISFYNDIEMLDNADKFDANIDLNEALSSEDKKDATKLIRYYYDYGEKDDSINTFVEDLLYYCKNDIKNIFKILTGEPAESSKSAEEVAHDLKIYLLDTYADTEIKTIFRTIIRKLDAATISKLLFNITDILAESQTVQAFIKARLFFTDVKNSANYLRTVKFVTTPEYMHFERANGAVASKLKCYPHTKGDDGRGNSRELAFNSSKDIGVMLRSEAEGVLAKRVAELLDLSYNVYSENDSVYRIAMPQNKRIRKEFPYCIRINLPGNIAELDINEYLNKIGKSLSDIQDDAYVQTEVRGPRPRRVSQTEQLDINENIFSLFSKSDKLPIKNKHSWRDPLKNILKDFDPTITKCIEGPGNATKFTIFISDNNSDYTDIIDANLDNSNKVVCSRYARFSKNDEIDQVNKNIFDKAYNTICECIHDYLEEEGFI